MLRKRLSCKHLLQSVFILFLVVYNLKVKAQVLPSSANLSYLYSNSSPITLRHQLVSSTDKNWAILELNASKTIADSLVVGFATTPSLDKPLNDFVQLEMDKFRILQSGPKQIFAIDVTNVDSKYVIFRIIQQSDSKGFTYIVELGPAANFILSTSQLTVPNIKGYTNLNSPLKISSFNGAEKQFGVKFYSKLFKPAQPPMGDLATTSPFENPDTVFIAMSGSKLPTNKVGTYTLFSEENEEYTTFFRIEDVRFPKVATVDELINTSVFLWTSDEIKKLRESDDPKKTFDRFWLNNTNSPSRAGKTISAYFNRVKEANEKFTTFKEGWKTDMGMIYIIFGPPDKAFKTNSGMLWIYKKTYELPGFTFRFFNNNKYITSDYYELERSTQFQIIWFRAIELWRKGRKSL